MTFDLNLRNWRPCPWWPGWIRVGFRDCRGRWWCQADVGPTGEVRALQWCRAHQPPRGMPVPVPVTPATDAEVAEFVEGLHEQRRGEVDVERAQRRG